MVSGFDLPALRTAVAAHGAVVRVVIADFRGSTPRESGTAMLVWDDGQAGTIGGGALEWDAAALARRLAAAPGLWTRQLIKRPLGPALGQCCGGHVTLLLERFAAAEIAHLAGLETARHFVRPVASGVSPSGARALDAARSRRGARSGESTGAGLRGESMVEPLALPALPLWIYGAGHVGRAVVRAATDLPLAVTWIDTAADRFPQDMPPHADPLVAAEPARAVVHAPEDAAHLVMTYSHTLDLAICHAVLARPFRHLGLIGSASKRARFLSRLRDLGHGEAALARLTCPIGDRSLGKLPAAIALGVVAEMLRLTEASAQPVARPA
jgi:xanthine dehydrogenase accessory factor